MSVLWLPVQGNELGQQSVNVHVIVFTFITVLPYFVSLPLGLLYKTAIRVCALLI